MTAPSTCRALPPSRPSRASPSAVPLTVLTVPRSSGLSASPCALIADASSDSLSRSVDGELGGT